jgi:rhodanese-related sulfurtransferase
MGMMALRMLGYTDVLNLGGGLGAWKSTQLPVAGWIDWPATYAGFISGLPAEQGFLSIPAAKLNEALASEPPFILDVREPAEVEAAGHISGSVNIPSREVLRNLDKLPDQAQKIVVTCASGHRGALVMMALSLLGYTDVVNLGGGTNAWAKAELPLEAGLPAAAVAAGVTPIYDAARFAGLDAYLSNLPEGFYTVKAADVNAELASEAKPFVLDVRTPDEVAADGHIEGSTNLPITELPARVSELPTDKAAPIVVLCKSGHRGALAMAYLQSLGFTNVRNLGGGMSAWIGAELPVVQ